MSRMSEIVPASLASGNGQRATGNGNGEDVIQPPRANTVIEFPSGNPDPSVDFLQTVRTGYTAST